MSPHRPQERPQEVPLGVLSFGRGVVLLGSFEPGKLGCDPPSRAARLAQALRQSELSWLRWPLEILPRPKKVDPLLGSIICTIRVLGFRIGGSTCWIFPEVWVRLANL